MLWQTFWAYNYGKEDIRADYYWSTIETDIANYVQRCERCHKCAYNHIHQQTSCATWYLHGYFFGGRLAYYDLTQELRDKLNIWQQRSTIFTKWVEVETLATITSKYIENFVLKHIICRFGIPNVIIADRDTQFIDRQFCQLLSMLNIKQRFTSTEQS